MFWYFPAQRGDNSSQKPVIYFMTIDKKETQRLQTSVNDKKKKMLISLIG
jgi:hypothetical protein